MTDPYQTLGIGRDSSAEAIKAAYRKRAVETHPDTAGGDGEAFKEVNAAYELLSDPDRRARFDQNGEVDDLQVTAEKVAAEMLVQAVGSTLDVERYDVTKTVIDNVQRQQAEYKRQAGQHRNMAERLRKFACRISRTEQDEPNMAKDAAEAAALACEASAKQADRQYERGTVLLEVLAGYKYKTDARPSYGGSLSYGWGSITTT